MKAVFKDGYFAKKLLVYGESMNAQTVVSKGFYLDVPSLMHSGVGHLNNYYEAQLNFLATLNQKYNLQVNWGVDSNYAQILEGYEKEEGRASVWNRYVRSACQARFENLKELGVLKRERLVFFLSKKCSDLGKRSLSSKGAIEAYLEQEERFMSELIRQAVQGLPQTTLLMMDDREHFKCLHQFFNPSIPFAREDAFSSQKSIFQNVLNSDISFHMEREGAYFCMDQMCHAIIVLRQMPQTVYPGVIYGLTGALRKDYSITQNIYPVDVQREVQQEEQSIRYLNGMAAHGKQPSLMYDIESKHQKIGSLKDGYTLPFEVCTIIRIWALSPKELFEKSVSVKSAIQSMGGATYAVAQMETQCRSLLATTVPGWTGGGCHDWDLYMDNHALAAMMPVSKSFNGNLDNPEALYESTEGSLAGLKTFSGSTPQHAVLIGMTGAGKSVAMADLLSQTANYYDYTAIIEEGLSYGFWTRVMGEDPIIVTPNGGLTFNYLDTQGLPLVHEQLTLASKLCLKMVGISEDEDKNNYRASLLGDYLKALYIDKFESWRRRNTETFKTVLKEAYAISCMQKDDSKKAFLDCFLELKDLQETHLHEYEARTRFSEEVLLKFSKDLQLSEFIMRVGYAYFKPQEYPCHSELVELMKASKFSGHEAREVDYLATMLSAWCRGGDKGCLFDGPMNVDLKRSIVHFELGMIPESAKELKEAVGFLITNIIRQHIIQMPRKARKRLIFEEASRFMDIPGGDKIMAESYAQLRKFSCWVICVTQQYAQLKNSRLKSVIFGNSKLFLLMRQNDREDLEEIAQLIDLPDIAKQNILKYPLPEHMESQKRCSFMTIYTVEGDSAQCGSVKIQPDPALLLVASSNGEHYDNFSKMLKNAKDPLEAVFGMLRKGVA